MRTILRRTQREGDEALRYYSRKFDGVIIRSLRLPEIEIKRALENADPRFVKILREAAVNIRRFHQKQLRRSWILKDRSGTTLRQLFIPIRRIGVYVPGGKAAYPSTVLMNVIPAQVAGVKEIHLVTPPDRNGSVHPDVLAAAAILGIRNVYRVGGAQAIAALAFGTETIPQVDKIVGPGNAFVVTAKKLVYGSVGIDNLAGPSEVVILADNSARADFVAADMLAQSEHDSEAWSVLVTTSPDLTNKVDKELRRFLHVLPRRLIIEKALRRRGAMILIRDMQQGVRIIDEISPEHLEIMTRDPEAALSRVHNAGAIFLGNYSPVAVGDYFAGPNHVLPTGRTARFSSPLSVDDFLKKSSVVYYPIRKMRQESDKIAEFAEREGLTAHALSVRLRGRDSFL